MTKHTPINPPPNLDTILRSRLTALLQATGKSMIAIAEDLSWSSSTLRRRLHLDSTNAGTYRRLHTQDVDDMLEVVGLPVTALLEPVLEADDRVVLTWIAMHTPADPMPSQALLDDCPKAVRVDGLYLQGLLQVCADHDDAPEYLRLTSAGQTALR